jgi:hypothetical protein
MVVKHSLHKTLGNQIKEKLLDYVQIDSGTKYFLLTDQRIMVADPAAAEPQSIPLHRTCHALCPHTAVHHWSRVTDACRFMCTLYLLSRRGVELV